MARIAGVDIPRDKRVVISLTYIYGIGKSLAQKILKEAGINIRDPKFWQGGFDVLDKLVGELEKLPVESKKAKPAAKKKIVKKVAAKKKTVKKKKK